MTVEQRESGFSLVELLVAVVIVTIGATAVIPSLVKSYRQNAVDSYTQKLEVGLNQLKANMIMRQDSCIVRFPDQASRDGIRPSDIDAIQITSPDDCPEPTNMEDGNIMASTNLRLVNLKGTQNNKDEEDIRIRINPKSIAFNTIGGVTTLDAEFSSQLIVRVRSIELADDGFERCLVMEPTTGELISGTWRGQSIDTGQCTTNQ